jgi:hypothetical protein
MGIIIIVDKGIVNLRFILKMVELNTQMLHLYLNKQ